MTTITRALLLAVACALLAGCHCRTFIRASITGNVEVEVDCRVAEAVEKNKDAEAPDGQ